MPQSSFASGKMANIFSNAWRVLDSVVNRLNGTTEESLASILPNTTPTPTPTSTPSSPTIPSSSVTPSPSTTPKWSYPQTKIRIRGPAPASFMWTAPSTLGSRHVAFTRSTLQHVAHREIVIHGETSGFQNFVRQMYESYYQMKLDQEWRQGLLEDEYPIHNRRLSFNDLVLLQRVARDMWHHMARERRKVYKDLAKEVKQRRRLRLPPDPYRTPVTMMGKKRLHKTKSIYHSLKEFE
ncbi:uncharacterized protein LOC117587206 [Drosophila guanche]|uniref:Uncharacterized protein n=1 Tax=Drosophila guanche TaxID=7266 RepID=A0A3B0JUU3_DROGU|nr:uncharacterized protein LOC117587206 [Drosophila guanche]SPP84833.1 Hypothetical predicted protein [Drosophila guanche]